MATKNKRNVQRDNNRKIVAKLVELGGYALSEETIDRGGQLIRLPEGMTLKQGYTFLQKLEQELEATAAYSETYDYRPYDGAYACWSVFRKVFGAVRHRGQMGFWGRQLPQLMQIASGYNEKTEVPWGELNLPALPDVQFILGAAGSPNGPVFQLSANGPRRRKAEIYGVFALVREELASNSLYRGKAVDGELNFLNLDAVDPSKVVYSTTSYEALKANIWTPIQHATKLQELGLPSKRAVLLHGDWGTGKTLAAYLTAQIAVRNGWTFLRARPGVDDLNTVMGTAKLYAPAVVFFEDIDIISDPDRLEADEASQLLDSFDGMAAKGQEVLAVMTTNHIERIHKGMVRPGRLDAVIELGALDQPRTLDLLLTTIPSNLVDEADVMANETEVAAAHEGYTPAFVVESAGRAMRYAVARSSNGETPLITGQDLVHAGNGLRNQLDLMQEARSDLSDVNIDKLLETRVKDVTKTALGPLYERLDVEPPK